MTEGTPQSHPKPGDRLYWTAKACWEDWHHDPDADRKIEDPESAVLNTLIAQGAHPREAAWLSRIALDTVIDEMHQEK